MTWIIANFPEIEIRIHWPLTFLSWAVYLLAHGLLS